MSDTTLGQPGSCFCGSPTCTGRCSDCNMHETQKHGHNVHYASAEPDQTAPARLTDALREAAEGLRDLEPEGISCTDDPLTVVTNLHAALSALGEAWPTLARRAGVDQEIFSADVERGLSLARVGMWDARNSI